MMGCPSGQYWFLDVLLGAIPPPILLLVVLLGVILPPILLLDILLGVIPPPLLLLDILLGVMPPPILLLYILRGVLEWCDIFFFLENIGVRLCHVPIISPFQAVAVRPFSGCK